jgi:hypothetical protein
MTLRMTSGVDFRMTETSCVAACSNQLWKNSLFLILRGARGELLECGPIIENECASIH